MDKLWKYITLLIILGFFALGFYVLFAPRMQSLPSEVKVIFAIFLFLYGAFRLVRFIFKDRDQE
jgi:hypothetical protein